MEVDKGSMNIINGNRKETSAINVDCSGRLKIAVVLDRNDWTFHAEVYNDTQPPVLLTAFTGADQDNNLIGSSAIIDDFVPSNITIAVKVEKEPHVHANDVRAYWFVWNDD